MRNRDRPPLGRMAVNASVCAIMLVAASAAAEAQVATKSPRDPSSTKSEPDRREILVVGQRQSAVSNVAPIATVDSDTIAATGATSMGELLRVIKPLAQSADGSDPIFLLNGQRTSGYEEIGSLPPERSTRSKCCLSPPR